jgi:hypothetical protein
VMMIIETSLCTSSIGSFFVIKIITTWLDHDNYKWSLSQQLCAIMIKV